MTGKVEAHAPPGGCFDAPNWMGENDIYEAIKLWLQTIFTKHMPIYQGQTNRVSMNNNDPFIIIQVITSSGLSLNENRYTSSTKIIKNHEIVKVQFDFYGSPKAKAFNLAKKFKSWFYDCGTYDFFKKHNIPLSPVNHFDINVRPFINAEDQWSDRYIVEAIFDYFPEFERCEDSAKEIIMTVIPANT